MPATRAKTFPSLLIEQSHWRRGRQRIAGVDEAGRGPLAGPVVTAAVVLDPARLPNGLNDSKKLTEAERERLYSEILESADVAFAFASAATIDRINIRAATLEAMSRAVRGLSESPDFVLIDGNAVPPALAGLSEPVVKGDAKSVSIAAASICAKVMRDRLMTRLDPHFPAYCFAGHKGYGTEAHRQAIAEHGPCPLHRMTFAPIAQKAIV